MKLFRYLLGIFLLSTVSIFPTAALEQTQFRLFFTTLQLGASSSTIEGQIEFSQSGCSYFELTLDYDPDYIYVLRVEVEGFDPFVHIDDINGIVNIQAHAQVKEATLGATTAIKLIVVPQKAGNTALNMTHYHVTDAGVTDAGVQTLDNIVLTNSGVLIQEPPGPTPTLSPAKSTVTVSVASANLRSGPGINYPVIGYAYNSESFELVSSYTTKDPETWYKVKREEGWAWIHYKLVVLNVGAQAIPVETDIPEPPPPTLTALPPTVDGSVLEGDNPPPSNNNSGVAGGNNPLPPSLTPPPSAVPDKDADNFPDVADDCPEVWGSIAGCPDNDGDGIPNHSDSCPNEPGTNGGCPSDRDGDGFTDDVDNCPDTSGTLDGCPEVTPASVDRDGDGFTDDTDACPEIFGTVNGCPEVTPISDRDADGFPDDTDGCPDDPDLTDGCPDVAPPPDSDGDGFTDDVDNCPSDWGTIQGCPEGEPSEEEQGV